MFTNFYGYKELYDMPFYTFKGAFHKIYSS